MRRSRWRRIAAQRETQSKVGVSGNTGQATLEAIGGLCLDSKPVTPTQAHYLTLLGIDSDPELKRVILT